MSDYGHDLLFGTFITPRAQEPQQPVALAQVTEQAGLDLVSFQDHPYQPAFLDTWTLLSYVAARTERVHVAANVTNLPLRPPAVLARAAASLDLLTGGRFALGLGAGAFWDAIEAMGGTRLRGGEAVEAVEEAVQVVRQMWDVEQRGGVRVQGKHHRVVGAKRGPAPAHDVPIWVGAYKPRMLRLVGRLADGSLPSLGYLGGAEALRGMNEVIDEAAAEAGRDPRVVRRLLNIGLEDAEPERLAELTLEYGVSGFVLGTDDPRVIQRYGQETAPAVRALVDAERAGQRLAATSVVAPEPAPVAVQATPDDGQRLSATSPWDESARPTAPVPAAEPGDSERGSAVSAHLVEVHDALRAELGQVRDLVDQVRKGTVEVGAARSAINQMTIRQNTWTLGTYCQQYCRIVTGHHSLEDEGIFPHLRRSEPALAPVLDRLEEEHHVIHDVLEQVDRALVGLAAHPDDLTQLVEAVDLMTDTLLSHFAYEERELLGPLARYGMYAGQL